MDDPHLPTARHDVRLIVLAAGLGVLGGILGSTITQRTSSGREGEPARVSAGSPVDPGARRPGNTAPKEIAVDVVERASPAVVAVIVSKEVSTIEDVPFDPFGDGPFGSLPFRPRIRRPSGDAQRRDVGGGSGFVVDPDGLIITNKHVVSDEDAEYDVVLNTGERVRASVAARDPVLDLAVLTVKKQQLPTLLFGDSDSLKVGQSVIAIGNALGEFRNTVSVGVISGLGRQVRAGDHTTGEVEVLDAVIQTDAAINFGNSGGPLLDLDGKAIGVNTAVAGGAQNIGFAIPINEVTQVVDDYRRSGRIIRPILGVRYVLITPAVQARLQLPVSDGALLVRGDTADAPAVVPGSPADAAGLREGDVILDVDGTPVNQKHPLQSSIRTKRPGDSVRLTVLSRGERKTLSVTLEEAK